MGVSCVQSGFLDWYPFDPAKLDSAANQEKEVKNGRLAMVSHISSNAGSLPWLGTCLGQSASL